GKFKETNCLSLFVSGNQYPENWNTNKENINFYHLKGVIVALLERFGIKEDRMVSDSSISNNFAYGLTFSINNKALVQLGEVSSELQKQFEINQPVYFAQLNLDEFIKIIKKYSVIYSPISKFPLVRRDLSLLLDIPTTYEALKIAAFKQEKKLLKKVNLFDVYEGKNLEQGKKSYAMSFIFQDENKTLTDYEVDKVMQRLIFSYTNEFNAVVR
ncbi:MAG: phenylalanine--tRNA ligase subunit beta, partial [Flavobacteriales bacterium]|nr:phenylalanine--tRNA ligase subunit beta [Flavobacteriales bacterium]